MGLIADISEAITDALTDWMKDLLVPAVQEQIEGIFDSTNLQIADISTQVGKTPASWNGSVYTFIRNLSDTVVLPVAGAILAFVMTLELIQMVTEKNNMQDFDTWLIFKWAFRAASAILIVSNTWNIVNGIFEVAQSMVSTATDLITTTDIDPGISEATLYTLSIGSLLGLLLQCLLINIVAKVVSICVMIIVYGRMFEIYLVTSIAPIPMATMLNKEWGSTGQNYIRSLLALAFQGFMIIVSVAIYYVLIGSLSFSEDISAALWAALGYSVLLVFVLFKTSGLAKSVFNAH